MDQTQAESAEGGELRLDELARRAGVASTTVRLYQSKGLLAPPRLEGRTGWYGEAHLRRLQLIARLQDQGFSLAGIARLFADWEEGRSLDAVIGVEAELGALVEPAHALVIDVAELVGRFPDGALTPELVQRAAAMGLAEPTEDGKLRIVDRRFLETGSALAELGLPLEVILDEWEALVALTDQMAARFVALFETYLAPDDWHSDLDSATAATLARTLARLRSNATQVVPAALDQSIARLARDRLSELLH